jgi:hypothetical protein
MVDASVDERRLFLGLKRVRKQKCLAIATMNIRPMIFGQWTQWRR